MLRILISIALLFAYVTETKGSAEWVSFKLFGVNGSKALDFIKMSDINSVIIRNAGLHFYYSIINKITENNSLLINNLTIGNNGYLWLATPFGIEKRTNIDTIKYSYKTRNVYDVTIDFNDNKWFASDSGLIKFDNINWTLFNKENSGFPAVKIWHICTSTKGDIWTVFSDSGSIGRFDGKVWKFYNSTQTGIKALGMDIRIVSDTSGRIWLRSNSQISYFDSTWHQITNISPDLLDAEGIYAQNDIIWLGGKGALIKLVNGSPTAINLPSFAGDYIGTIGIDSHDNKWLLTYKNNSSIPYLTIYREGGVIGNFVFVDSQNKSVIDSREVSSFTVSPNPFNSQLAISYTLPQPAQTSLSLCDIQGNEVAIIAPEQQSEGTVNLYYDASALPAGTYLLTLRVCGQTFSKKIIKM